MPDLAHRLQWLRNVRADAVVDILTSALRRATAEERDELARELIRTGRTDALASAIRRLHELTPDVLEAFPSAAALRPACEAIVASGDHAAARNVVHLVRARRDILNVDLLAALVVSGKEEVRAAAGAGLLQLTAAELGEQARRRARRIALDRLDAAIAEAAAAYRRHHVRDVLIALALVARHPGPRCGALLADRGHPIAFALRGVVEHFEEPLVRTNLLNWLAVEELARPVSRWLHQLRTPGHIGDVLAHGHLLRTPVRRRMLRQVDRPVRCAPDEATRRALPETAQRFLPEYVASVGMTSPVRVQKLAELADLASPTARWRAAVALSAVHAHDAREALGTFANDPDPVVAGFAAGHLTAESEAFEAERSANERVSRRGLLRAASRSPSTFFALAPDLRPSSRLVAALRVRAAGVRAFDEALRRMLVGPSVTHRRISIEILRRLRLTPAFEHELATLTTDRDARVAASAVLGLTEGTGTGRWERVIAALDHVEKRVRANAVEALTHRTDERTADRLEMFAADGHNRVRANAIAGLCASRHPAAVDQLVAMLGDEDPLHRVSAIWVARRSDDAAVAERLERVAGSDPVSEIRGRARSAGGLVRWRHLRRKEPAPT